MTATSKRRATPQECPLCFDHFEEFARVRSVPIEIVDVSLVTAYLAGMAAASSKVPIREALCLTHGRLAADACRFIMEHLPDAPAAPEVPT